MRLKRKAVTRSRAVGPAASLGAVLVVLAAPLAAGAQAPARAVDEALLRSARIPGVTLAVIEDGAVARSESLGVADAVEGTPISEATLFEAASLTKPVFATIVLRLAERGEVDLDQPLHELLADERIAHDSRSEALTARIVLSHRTGLPNWGSETLEFEFDPGERFGYSGEGYQYLQRVIEAVTGLGLDALARREIFGPLGMTQSLLSWSEQAAPVLAVPHDTAGRPQDKHPVREAMAAATLHTTAAEYGRFVAAWMNGELLRPATMAEALEPVTRMVPDDDASEVERAAMARLAWGLGWGLQLPAEGDVGSIAWHWGDNGNFKAFVAFDPAARRGIVYFANSANGLALGPALVEPVVGDLQPTFEWLDYPRWDDPGESDRLSGVIAAGEGRYGEAIGSFEAALAAGSDDESLATRLEWLRDLQAARSLPPEVEEATLRRWVGTYGPRTLRWEEGALWYQREGRSPFRLIPLSKTLFALEGEPEFRIEVELGESGEPTKLIGLYVNGDRDESPRTADEGGAE